MKKMNLRIADLRRKRKITQKELAEAMGVSFQTISKWEKGVNLPDITILPAMAEYFKVSIDQLMGVVPLQGEEYMVEKVWKIDKPVKVLDCGCGFVGLLIMPLLPKGSTYTGIDLAEKLLEEGQKLFADKDYEVRFLQKDVYEYHVKEQYDLVICQGVLRHLDTPEAFLKKMIEFAKKDAHWRTELEQQGRDYAVAIRTAHMMQKLGLREVDVRMKDKVAFVTPAQEDYEQTKQDFLEYNDWNAGYTFAKGTMISYGKK